MEANQGRRRVVAAVLCLLGALAAPLDPADHPHGCDLAPTGEGRNSGVNFVGRAADVLATGYMHLGESPIAHGEVYAGYTAEQFSPVEEGGHYDAWGMWITQGVDCPSGDFHNCRTGQ